MGLQLVGCRKARERRATAGAGGAEAKVQPSGRKYPGLTGCRSQTGGSFVWCRARQSMQPHSRLPAGGPGPARCWPGGAPAWARRRVAPSGAPRSYPRWKMLARGNAAGGAGPSRAQGPATRSRSPSSLVRRAQVLWCARAAPVSVCGTSRLQRALGAELSCSPRRKARRTCSPR
jgi:hypothetical protein